ncbi:MAG TPA: NAD(P)-dependent oxidoreductase [Fimbriimonadaceae bacterium]|nr:NAD(P)-dependent oxidoreductase [Fimbriimonadaceae bacterium]HRJ32674.1 NAD(P)-dependent oxidoreductase [Fimbriimonadaceae bacterium]
MSVVGFVGLGVMGGPMAGHLVAAGKGPVWVWNRTPAKGEPLRAQGAQVAESLADLAQRCETIILCLGATEDVQEVCRALAPLARPGTLFIDHSTISPQGAEQLHAELAAQQLRFVDAPITGGSMGAQKGTLTIFLGGDPEDCGEAASSVSPYAKRAERVGGPGAGQRMKMANQIAVGGALLALCESLSFAQKAGLDLAQTRELLAGGAAGSWAFDNYGPKILASDWSPGFSIKNQNKDFRYCEETASQIGADVPGVRLVHRLLAEIEARGDGELTTCVLFEELLRRGFDS